MVFYVITKHDPIGLLIHGQIVDYYSEQITLKKFIEGEIFLKGTGEHKGSCYVCKYKGKRRVFEDLKFRGFKETEPQNGIRTLIP